MAVIDEIREEQGTAGEEQKHLAEQSRPAMRYLVQANLLAIRPSARRMRKESAPRPRAARISARVWGASASLNAPYVSCARRR